MSVLSFPRLHLRGAMSWDPVVSNNDPAVYDEVAARARLAPGERVACFRERMIAHEMDRVLLDRTVALVRSGAMTESDRRAVSKTLRAEIDSRPLAGAGKVGASE